MKLMSSLMITLVLTTALSAQTIPAEKRLPPGVLAFGSIPSVPDLGHQLKDTSTGALINDPALDDFRQQIIDKFKELNDEAEGELGFPLSDLEALLAGELTLAAIRPIGQQLGGVLMMNIGDHNDIFEKLVEKAEEALENQGAEKETDELDGTKVTLYTTPADSDQPNSTPRTIAWCLKDQTVVVASSVMLIESLLERWDGNHQMTFADSEIYTEIMNQCAPAGARPSIIWYYEPIQLALAGMAASPEMAMASAMASAYMPILGLNNLKGVGGVIEMATEEYDSISRTMIYAEAPVTGVLKVFEMPSTLQGPPAWVSANSGMYFGFHWNVEGAYQSIETMYDTFTGQPGAFDQMVSQTAKRADGPDLHPKDDIIDALTGVVHMSMNAPEEGSETPTGMISVHVKDVKKAQSLLDAMSQKNEFEIEEYSGAQIYKLTTGVGAAAIHQDAFFFASSVDYIKNMLDGKGVSLKDDPNFKQLTSKLPPKQSYVSFANAANGWEQGYENLRNGEYDSVTEGELDFSVLPPFAKISKHFIPYTSYGVQIENGALMVQYGLRKE